jgi:hypothetical protein
LALRPVISNVSAGADMDLRFVSKEVIDPRFNWSISNFTDNRDGGNSLGGINSNSDYFLSIGQSQRAKGFDWDLAMHVSDAGQLSTVGELGNLCRSSIRSRGMLQTVRLIDYDTALADKVLDYFTNMTPGERQRGFINANSLSEDRLACAFWDMPLNAPSSTASPDDRRISDTQVTALVRNIISWRKASAANKFATLSDLGKYNWRNETAIAGDVHDIGLETLVANSAGLMTTRQNMFVAIIAAKPFSLGVGVANADARNADMGSWVGIRRAVVHLQRDPYPVEVGPGIFKCRTRVQRFRWLGDE